MIRRFSPLRPSVRARRAGFTLIELLTVIAIILVLAGLLINVAGSANYKGSFARAQSEVKAMETALESYKADNGAYPRDPAATSSTDTLNAQPVGSSAPADPSTYTTAGKYLYKALSGFVDGSTFNKRYMEFKPGQLSTGNGAATTDTYVIDPFGFAYGYSTAYQKEQERVVATPGATVDTTKGYNPTFDLWSTGGYAASGKKYPTGASTGSAAVALWAKNW